MDKNIILNNKVRILEQRVEELDNRIKKLEQMGEDNGDNDIGKGEDIIADNRDGEGQSD